MPSRRTFLALPPCLPWGIAQAAGTASVWVTSEAPPYLWRGQQGPEGYAFELFLRVLKQADLKVDLVVYPWARAYRMLEDRQAQAALVMTRTAEREGQFRWLFPVGSYRLVLVSRMADPAPLAEMVALRPLRVASLRASVARGSLAAAGVQQVVEGRDFSDLIALLRRGIVDVAIGPDPVMRNLGAGDDQLRYTTLEALHQFNAAAGPAMPDGDVLKVRNAYRQLLDAGVVTQLRKRHPGIFSDE